MSAATAARLIGARVIDGISETARTDVDVVIEAGLITGAEPNLSRGSEVDLDGLTLLPGLIDAHTHLAAVADTRLIAGMESVSELAAMVFRNCELALDGGFTTCREVGGLDGGIVRAIERGLVRGPRILPSGAAIVQDGGHGSDQPPFAECFCPVSIPGLFEQTAVCNGPEEVRLAVRRNFRRGATQIKLIGSGGVVSITDVLADTQLTTDEIEAAVIEARARNTYVTVHAHNARAIKQAVLAGVTCAEHGTNLDEETAELMAARGCALVPTLTVIDLMAANYSAWGLPESVVPRLAGVADGMRLGLRMARKHRVVIGLGSDLLGPNQNRRGRELALRAELETPMSAIIAATSLNARILGIDRLVGSVQAGLRADLIAVEGDPTVDPGLLDAPDRIVLVIKDGLVVKDTQSRFGAS